MSEKFLEKMLYSLLVIAICFLVYRFIINILTNRKNNFFSSKKGKTYAKMFKSILKYATIIITLIIVLEINGVNISSMMAGLGIVGIIVGFAIQDALKDIVKGIDIISDSYYQVGDVIKFNNIEGKVLSIGIKTTKIEDVRTMNIVSISNRNIEQVEVVSNLINIDIPIPYEIKVNDAEKAIADILNEINKIKEIEKSEYRGIDNLADSSIKYQIKVYCLPIKKIQIRRDVLRIIILGLDKYNIDVPYNQIDIHQK